MKTTTIPPSAGEVFTVRQYSDITLTGIHRDLRKNPQSRKRGSWEQKRLEMVVEEIKRRGIQR